MVSGLAPSKARGSRRGRSSEERWHLQYGRRVDVARGTTEETRGISAGRRGLTGKLISLLLWSGRDLVIPEYLLIW